VRYDSARICSVVAYPARRRFWNLGSVPASSLGSAAASPELLLDSITDERSVHS
jgi:hypothetical protein